MNQINLTAQEIKDITGKTHRSKQMIVLAVLQIPFKERPDGSILVSRDAYNQVMGCDTTIPQASKTLPNFDAM